MITNLLLVSALALIALPILFIGYLVETKKEKEKARLRDEYARQSHQQTILNNQTK